MSNVGQAVLTIGGTIVGGMFGMPQLGYLLGSMAGQALFPTDLGTVSGPRLQDLTIQTSTVGSPIPIVYGTYAIAGNLIWSSGIIEKVTRKKQGGKGGPTQTTKTYSYSVNCAVGVCEGEITLIGRIWADAKLLCDGRPQRPDETLQSYNARMSQYAAFLSSVEIYTGTETQLADPTIESFEGAGNVSAFRGLAYVVFTDFQLEDYGNRIPNFRFEVSAAVYGALGCATLTEASGGVVPEWNETGYDPRLGGYEYEYNLSYRALPSFNNVLTGGWTADIGGVLSAHGTAAGRAFVDEIHGFTATNQMTSTTAYRATVFPCDPSVYDTSASNKMTLDMRINSLLGIGRACLASGETFDDYISPGTGPMHIEWPPGTTSDNPGFYEIVANASANTIGGIAATVLATYGPNDKVLFLADNVIKIRRSLQVPLPLCYGEPESEIPGYCLVDGLYIQNDATWTYNAGAYRGIKIYEFSGTFPNTFITQRPIGPFISEGDPRWTDQTYWEGVYAEAVASGAAPSGWTYDVEYPREGSGHWVTTYEVCGAEMSPDGSSIQLGAIVRDVCRRCGIPVEQVDVSDLTEYVDGYVLSRVMNGRDAIEPLRTYGFFDCVESATTLKWPTRGKAAVKTLTDEDLAARWADGSPAPSVESRRQQSVELPLRLRIHYTQTNQNYEVGEQSASRITAPTSEIQDIELPIAMQDTKAAQIADVVLYERWVARNTHNFALGTEHLNLEPADAITLPIDGRQERVRIVDTVNALPGLLAVSAVRDDDGSYVSYVIGSPNANAGPGGGGATPSIPGTATTTYLNLPLLTDTDNDPGYYVASYADGGTVWGGALVYRSPDGGINYEEVGVVTLEATLGNIVYPVSSGPTTVMDTGSEIIVTLDNGELESVAEASLLAGYNAAVIGADGRWEVVQFMTAELISGTTWRLTNLLRGRRGTEEFVGISLAGDEFVLIDNALVRILLNAANIGQPRYHKTVLSGGIIEDATPVLFTGTGNALKPFSVIDVAGSRDMGGDLTITWIRRGRIGSELPSGSDIPLSEATEAYEVDIYNGSSVVRTLSTGVQSVVYTAAQQTTDFGSPQASVSVIVYQMSATVGRGYPSEATV
jgi:hypothetical protein